MNKLATKIAVAGTAIATLGALALASTSMVSAATTNGAANSSTQGFRMGMMNWGNREQQDDQNEQGEPRGPRMLMQNVQRTVQNTTNGVTVTLTSTDAATVTKLQSRPQPTPPANSNITITQTNISNGIQITTTSTDSATVTKIQDREKNGPEFGHFRDGKGGPGMMGLGMFDKNVTRSVQKIGNGINITLTSTDAATVTKLQQLAGN